MLFYLLTFQGKFLCRGNKPGSLAQVPLESIGDRTQLATIDVPKEAVRPDYASFIGSTPGTNFTVEIRHFGSHTVSFNPATKTVSIDCGGQFLGSLPDGRLISHSKQASGWEQFALLTDDDLDVLQLMKDRSWIVRSTREVVPVGGVCLGDGHSLIFGGLHVPVPFNFPIDKSKFPFSLPLLQDGWRINEVLMYRPLIFYVASGANSVLKQFYISIRSLIEVADYTGDVIIFTDRSHEEICAAVPSFPPERLHVARIPAKDWVGFVAGKYCILEEERAWHHQPVAYMDPDIVYNTSATTFLVPMVTADRPTAPLELFSNLDTNPSVGATLLQRDNAQPRFACGFNGGTIGFPNIPHHVQTITMIRRVIENFLARHGRNALSWVDQEAANYVSYKFGNFDTNEMSICVRYGGRDYAKWPTPRTGLVHFWMARDRDERIMVMQAYLDRLLAEDGKAPVAAPEADAKPRQLADQSAT